MNSRESILKSIRENRPGKAELPEIPTFALPEGTDLVENFRSALKANSGESLVLATLTDLNAVVEQRYPEALQVCSLVSEINGNISPSLLTDLQTLKNLDLVIVRGELAVAENAAVWLSEKTLPHRVLPFITQHLIIVISQKELVANMHEAYKNIRVDEEGYGVFIAGPSKTADIEQTLVIGAHGARSLTVAITD